MTDTQDSKAAVAKAQQLLYRRFKVTLIDNRSITGDFQCLDKEGNLILGNAHEIIEHHRSGGPTGTGACNGAGGNNGSGRAAPAPMEKQLGVVLVPKAQQKDIQLQVTLSEKAAMLQLAAS